MMQVTFPSAKAIENHLQTDSQNESHFSKLFKANEYFSAHGLTRNLCNEFEFKSMNFNVHTVEIMIWGVIEESTTLPKPVTDEDNNYQDAEIRKITCSLARLVNVELQIR